MIAAEPWPGCHGVHLPGAPIELGRSSGDPLATATMVVGDPGDVAGDELWRVELDVVVEGRSTHAEQRLWRRPDGSFLVRNNRGGALSVDATGASIVVDGPDDAVVAQLVTTYALPLLHQCTGALVVHASAFELAGSAVLVSGASGRGKSSLLVAAIDAGYRPLSEDLCVVDLRGSVPVVWPGPPWVRRRRGEPGPRGARARFDTYDKTAWDIAPRQVVAALPLACVLGVQPPGGAAPSLTPVPRAEALRRLASDTVWLGDPARREVAMFEAVARVSGAVPFASLQLPLSPSWLDGVLPFLADALA